MSLARLPAGCYPNSISTSRRYRRFRPDLMYLSRKRLRLCRRNGVHGAPRPDLREILSPSTEHRDRGVKLEAFQRAGVPHVWLVQPEAPLAVEEYVRTSAGRYERREWIAPVVWSPAAFPGWSLDLGEAQREIALPEGNGGERARTNNGARTGRRCARVSGSMATLLVGAALSGARAAGDRMRRFDRDPGWERAQQPFNCPGAAQGAPGVWIQRHRPRRRRSRAESAASSHRTARPPTTHAASPHSPSSSRWRPPASWPARAQGPRTARLLQRRLPERVAHAKYGGPREAGARRLLLRLPGDLYQPLAGRQETCRASRSRTRVPGRWRPLSSGWMFLIPGR